ncbi:phosphatase domain-containing protein [uncultured Zobellia sp.]|uniref:App1 family protein n=1 Tax=uncultured Zobellia sp. TaxID=255433 RepID=UPI002598F5F0|nr:phosphatase domain-containing protein [uncultured Zobellia sp.]
MGLFGKKDKLQIMAFQGYGTNSHFYARGRALEDEEIDLSKKGFFNLIWNSYKRFETDEIRNTCVRVKLPDGRTLTGKTDGRGYYTFDEPQNNLEELTNGEGWLNYEISYSDSALRREVLHQNKFPGELLIPSATAQFGVISDIDDTILHTGVVSSLKWKVIVNTIFKRVSNRKPLKGTAEFYNLLHRGQSGKEANPIFYVSHSPWNMYRYLELFLQENDFPKGPILLRNFPSLGLRKRPDEKPQKQKEILNILKTYPNLKFILIGDSGEHDADIYKEIAELYPKQISAIYIRSVAHKRRMERVRSLFNAYKTTPVLLVETSEQAIEHAKANGFIANTP